MLLALSGPEAWTQRAADLLLKALADWGIGGKTSSGYGRMQDPQAKGGIRREPDKQLYGVGHVIMVTRVADPKGKGRAWFQADDGFSGTITTPLTQTVEIGATLELEIAAHIKNLNDKGYNFRMPQPK